MTVIVGFTGTRRGMSEKQKTHLSNSFRRMKAAGHEIEFHHGDCIGADSEGDQIARAWGAAIRIHPPTDTKYQAFCYLPGDVQYPRKPYIMRDHDIVDACMILFAGPKDHRVEEHRSGTWTTVRYARNINKRTSRKVRIVLLKVA